MKHIFIPIVLFFATLCLSSCYTTRLAIDDSQYNDQYIGCTYASIIDEFGPPSRTTPDGKNGTILIYEDIAINSDGYLSASGNAHMTSSKDVQYLHFYVDSNNYCYKTRSRFKKTEFNPVGTVVISTLGVLVFLLPVMIAGS